MASTCSKCGATIIWLRTPKGKWMPADEGLVPYRKKAEGKSYVVNDRGELIRCEILLDGSEPSGMARVPHWATCPFAEDFRKRGGGKNA